MPVVEVVGRLAQRHGVQVEVVGGVLQCDVDLSQDRAQRVRKRRQLLSIGRLEGGAVPAGEDRQLERAAGGPGRKHHHRFVLQHHPLLLGKLLREHVAEDAALLVGEVPARRRQLGGEGLGDERQRDQLRVGVVEGRARGRAMVLEDDHRLQPHVARQVRRALLPGAQHALDLCRRQARQGGEVIAGLDHHLVGAHARHAVEEAVAGARHLDLGAQRGIAVGHHAQRPGAALAPRQHLGRGHLFVPHAKGADALVRFRGPAQESARAIGALGRDDHPPARDGVSAELRHWRRAM